MRPTTFVLIAAIIAVAVRIGFTVGYRGGLDTVPVHKIAGADGVEYDQFARSLVAGTGYAWPGGQLTSFRAPGFPFVVAATYKLFGTTYPVAYISFAVWGAIGVVATYLLSRELMDDGRARWAAGLAAVYPPDVFACSYFFSEVVFAPVLGFGLWLLARQVRTGAWCAAFAAGLILGYAALTRSFGILFLPLFALYLLGNPLRRSGWVPAVLYGIGFLAVILPWTARNYQVHQKVVLIATNGGSTFYGANNPLVAGTPKEWGNWVSTTRLPGRDLIDAQPDEVAHDKMEYKLGVDWVTAHPNQFALLGVFKVVRFWLPFVQWPSFKTYPVVNILSTSPFLALILIGLIRTLATAAGRQRFALLHLTMFANLVMVVIFWGDPRFRDANVPVLMIYAVAGGEWVRDRIARRRAVPPTNP